LDNGAITGTTYGYGPGHVITDKREYDFGLLTSSTCGAPLNQTPTRETVTAYQAFAITPIYPGDASILDKPASISTYGTGTLVAQTLYSYDQVAVGSVSNLPTGTHDETNYSSSPVNSSEARIVTQKTDW
jgi:hypothetical protein